MTHYYQQRDFLNAAAAQRKTLVYELEFMDKLTREHQVKRAEVEQLRNSALYELTCEILPVLDPASLQRAVQLTGYATLTSSQPIERREHERGQIQHELATIAADPRYADRERLRAPRVGTLSRKLAELQDFRREPSAMVALASHPRLERLLQVHYGTDRYQVAWWRMSFYADWKAGDEILERFPQFKDFAALARELIAARANLAAYDPQIASLEAEIAAGVALEQRHAYLTETLASIETRHLEQVRGQLGHYLADLQPTDIADRVKSEPNIEMLLKRFHGAAAKLRYLDTIFQEQVEKPRAALKQELSKLDRDIVKWQRPKMAYQGIEADKFQRRFQDRSPKYRRHWDRYRSSYDTVYVFHDYNRYDFYSDYLWWDVMTDGRLDGNFIPEVAEHRHSHPGQRFTPHDSSAEDAAAVASIDADQDQAGSGLLDAS